MNMHLNKMTCEWSAPKEMDVVEAVGNLRPDVLALEERFSRYIKWFIGFNPKIM